MYKYERVPLVTVGIPYLNPGDFIIDAIKSVFAQTLSDWELILLDDGSTDNTTEVIKKISDPRVRIISDGKHRGLVYRLNQLIDLSRGTYFARMDADDIMHPERLEKQVKALESNKDIDLITNPVVIIGEERMPVGLLDLRVKYGNYLINAFKRGILIHPTVTARKKWYVINRYDPNFPRAEDREIFIRTIRTTNILYLDDPLLFYYMPNKIRINAFLQSYTSERKVLLKYGPSLIGWLQTYKLLLRSYLKSCFLIFCHNVGKEKLFFRYRKPYEHIDPVLYRELINVINNIKSVNLFRSNEDI